MRRRRKLRLPAIRAFRRRPHPKHASLAHWRDFGLRRSSHWISAEYGYVCGLDALDRQWRTRERGHRGWWTGSYVGRWARGKVYDEVRAAVQKRLQREQRTVAA